MHSDLASIRQDYTRQELSPEDCRPCAIEQFELWLEDAIRADVAEPTAMHVATVGEDGRPQGRILLLKGLEQGELLFYTNYNSRKGQAIAAHPYVALTFFWPELERQIRIEGTVRQLEAEVSDTYFSSRPYASRIGAWASPQSQPIPDKTVLIKQAALIGVRHPLNVPRPPHWGGYAVRPDRIEFWQGRPSRLHDRVLYERHTDTLWQRSRLAP